MVKILLKIDMFVMKAPGLNYEMDMGKIGLVRHYEFKYIWVIHWSDYA